MDRRAADEEPSRLVDDWTRLRGVVEEDLDGTDLDAEDRLELDGCGPTIRLEEDREVVLRLVGAGLTDLRTGAERGDALRDELGTLRRTLFLDEVAGTGRVMEGTGLVTDDDRPGSELLRLVVGDGVRLLVAGAVRTGVRLGTWRVVVDAPRLVVGAGCLRAGVTEGRILGVTAGRVFVVRTVAGGCLEAGGLVVLAGRGPTIGAARLLVIAGRVIFTGRYLLRCWSGRAGFCGRRPGG